MTKPAIISIASIPDTNHADDGDNGGGGETCLRLYRIKLISGFVLFLQHHRAYPMFYNKKQAISYEPESDFNLLLSHLT